MWRVRDMTTKLYLSIDGVEQRFTTEVSARVAAERLTAATGHKHFVYKVQYTKTNA